MGALHDGHLALLRAARRFAGPSGSVVMSLFVNPTQFGAGEDYARYPRDEARDLALARDEGVDLVFAPSADEMYPRGFATTVRVAGPLSESFEGSRPAGALRRRGHGGGEAVRDRAPRRGLLRPQGRAAARPDQASRRRPRPRRRGRRCRDGARGRRPRPELAQRLPRRARARGGGAPARRPAHRARRRRAPRGDAGRRGRTPSWRRSTTGSTTATRPCASRPTTSPSSTPTPSSPSRASASAASSSRRRVSARPG